MNRLIIISTLLVLNSCGQSKKADNSERHAEMEETSQVIEVEKQKTETNNSAIDKPLSLKCIDYKFNSVKEQADSLTSFMNRAINSDLLTRQIWEEKFFCAFPNSFSEMENLFGYNDELGAAPLYSAENPSQKYMNKRISSDAIGFFSELESIPSELYYEKYTNINIDGNWQADNIGEAFGFHYKLFNDTENVCKTLSKYDDKQIKSVFRFIFDGPYPENEYNEKLFNKLNPLLDKQNKRLGKLLTFSYEKLMGKYDRH